MKKLVIPFLTAAAVLGCVLASNGQVLVENTATNANGAAQVLTIPGFDMLGGNTLAVLISGESTSGNPSGYTVSYDGGGLTSHVFENEGTQGAAIFWMIGLSGAESGDVVVDLQVAHNAAISVLSLSGGVGVNATYTFGEGTSWDLPYTTGGDGVVVAAVADNGWGTASAASFSGGNLDTYLHQLPGQWEPGLSAGHTHAYGDIPSAGSYVETYNEPSNSSRNAGALVAFVAVPEPSTFALLVLGGVGTVTMVRRRQRA